MKKIQDKGRRLLLLIAITSFTAGVITGYSTAVFNAQYKIVRRYSQLAEPSEDVTDILKESVGDKTILMEGVALIRYNLPEDIHPHMDHSKFQPYMDYRAVTNKRSGAYKIINHKNAYCDKNGFRRIKLHPDEFSIDEKDDYLIALGNYYKEKGKVGDRFLVITSTGMYTARVGDEKANRHTDPLNMFTVHGKDRKYAGVIEWIIDSKRICSDVKKMGSISASNIPALQGNILHIYKIIG